MRTKEERKARQFAIKKERARVDMKNAAKALAIAIQARDNGQDIDLTSLMNAMNEARDRFNKLVDLSLGVAIAGIKADLRM